MAFKVEIVIEAKSETEAVQKTAEMVKRLGDIARETNEKVGQAAQQGSRQAADAYGRLDGTTKALTQQKLGLQRAVGLVASNLVGLGPAGNVAASAMLAVATGAGISGVAIGGISTAVFLLIQRFQEGAQKKKDFDAALRTGNLSFFTNEIAAIDQDLVGLGASIDEARRKVEALRAAGVSPGGLPTPVLAHLERQGQDLENRRTDLLSRQQDILGEKAQQATLALQFETAAVGANVAEQERLAHELRVVSALQGGLKDAAQGAKDAFIAQSEALRNARVGDALKRQSEEQSKGVDQARQAIMGQIEAIRLQTIETNDGAEAAALYKIANLANSDAVKKLGAEGMTFLAILRDETLEFIRNAEAQRQVRLQSDELAKSIAIAGQALEKQTEEENDLLREQLNLRTRLAQEAGDFELRKLRAAGLPEGQVLGWQLEILRQEEERIRNAPQITVEQNRRQQQLLQEIEITEIQMRKLGQSSIDVAGEVSRVVTDITSAVINGTLKWADIGKSVLASFLRLALEQFTGFLRQMQTQAGAMNMMGGVANVGSNGFGGGGGFLDMLSSMFSGGGRPAGVSGPVMQSGQFFSGTGGGGGGAIGSIVSTVGSGISKIMPAGSSIGGALGGVAGGFGIGQMINGTPGGIGGAIGGAAGSLIGGSTAIGSALGLTGSLTSSLAASLSGTLGATLGGMLAGMIIPGIGAIIGALISLLFKKVPNPSVWVQTIIAFYYDALAQAFGQVTQTTILKIKDIKGSRARDVAAQHHAILDNEGKRFAEVLNAFPVTVHEAMAATIDHANEYLNFYFGSKKYSDRGKRNIKKELEDLRLIEAPRGFFDALRETITVGFEGTLNQAGLVNAAMAARTGFGSGGVAIPTGVAEDTQKFVDAIGKLAVFSGNLANITPRGVTPFATDLDIERVGAEFNQVFSQSGTGFTTAVDEMIERLKPFTDFLQQSIQQSNELFGRGITAALEAATESDARMAFLNSLNSGVKDVIFRGITEAFIASAQFNEMLAPIQKTIREFTQQAAATGQLPDLGAFRTRILPHVEQISSRAETLAPLISELQKLGFEIRDKLKLTPAEAPVTNITINIGSMSDETDPRKLAEELGNMINPLLPPPT